MPRTPDHGQRVCEACGVRGVGVASPFPRMCDPCGQAALARATDRDFWTIAASDDRETQRELDWLRRKGYLT